MREHCERVPQVRELSTYLGIKSHPQDNLQFVLDLQPALDTNHSKFLILREIFLYFMRVVLARPGTGSAPAQVFLPTSPAFPR
jgi:hypothetical protein